MYHVHITDAGTSPVSAALLFAHLTLRAGPLADRLLVSASTISPATEADAQRARDSSAQAFAEATAEGRDDVLQMLTAAALLHGDDHDTAAGTLPADVVARLQPYPYFSQHFTAAERGLLHHVVTTATARTGAGSSDCPKRTTMYFDVIVAADLAAYDALLDYYNTRRRILVAGEEAQPHGPPTRACAPTHVAILHVASVDVARAGPLVQRFLAAILPKPIPSDGVPAGEQEEVAEGAEGGEASGAPFSTAGAAAAAEGGSEVVAQLQREAWMDAVDGTVASFSQLLGVDVLVTVL